MVVPKLFFPVVQSAHDLTTCVTDWEQVNLHIIRPIKICDFLLVNELISHLSLNSCCGSLVLQSTDKTTHALK